MERVKNDLIEELDTIYWHEKWFLDNSKEDRLKIILDKINSAEILIPIYSHRFIPNKLSSGYPIFSVYGADIIFYGKNLLDYYEREFCGKTTEIILNEVKYVEFWSDMIEMY